MKLRLAKDLTLPVDIVTQTMAILAKRRAGKSYLMRRLVEQLVTASQQVVLVDPKGDQWGVRSAADGKAPGLPLVILGGERADVPLEAGSGEIVAKLVVEERVSAVLDLSLFRKHEVATFMTAFLENLYRLKAKEVYRTPMMLVIDEADAIAPQKPQKGEERMLGAAEDIVRRGGQRGIGCVLVSQRSAVLNKNVLTQAQVLVVLRTIAPQDLAAMDAWIDVHGTAEQRKTLMESLPSLPVGDAWVWSPGWPTVDGIFARVHVLPIETFDSGATPKPGEKRVEPKTVADVDLEALKRQMSATIEKAKAEDPRELKRQIAELKKSLAKSTPAQVAKTDSTTAQVVSAPSPALTDADRALLAKLSTQFDELKDIMLRRPDTEPFDTAVFKVLTRHIQDLEARHEKTRETFLELLDGKRLGKVLEKVAAVPVVPTQPVSRHAIRRPTSSPPMVPPRSAVTHVQGNGDLSGPERKILASVAELEALGLHPADKMQVGLMAGYTNVRSGGFSEPLGRLVAAGYIESPRTGQVAITVAGRALVGQVAPPQSSEEMQARVMEKLTGPERRLLNVLIERYPNALTKEQLAEACDPPYTNIRSGGFSEPLGRLNTLGLVQSPARGEVVASPALFLEG